MGKALKNVFMLMAAAVVCLSVAGCSGSSGKDAGKDAGKEESQASAGDNAELSKQEIEKGIELISAGDPEQSLEHFDKAIGYDGANAKAWCARGTAMRTLGRMEEAVKDYTRALELKPDYVICVDNLGVAYMYKSDFESARGSFNKALELDPNYADAYFNLGTLYYEGLKEKEKAAMYFEKYIQLSKNPERIEQVKEILESMKKE